jgi:hypothetical protein
MAEMGHEDAFPPPRLSVRCGFSQRTFAGLPFETGRGLVARRAFSIGPCDGHYNSVAMNSPSAR